MRIIVIGIVFDGLIVAEMRGFVMKTGRWSVQCACGELGLSQQWT